MPLELKNTNCRAIIYPEFGGMVNHFYVRRNDSEIDVLYGYSKAENIEEKIHEDFRNVKLSPYANRIKCGQYTFDDQILQLDINFKQEGNSVHGFLFDRPFEVKLKSNNKLILHYEVPKRRFKGYPFSYFIELEYLLLERGLSCITTIKNTDSVIIPIADGFHPYFRIGETIDDIQLELPMVRRLPVDEQMIPTLQTEAFDDYISPELIGNNTFDDGFEIISTESEMVKTTLKKNGISICVEQEIGENKYNFLQVYTPPYRKAIAIEPMTSAPNGFNNELGLIRLNPSEEIEITYQFRVELD